MHVLSGATQIHINATPNEVYAIVADISHTPEWSPEVINARWAKGATGPAAGARFKGRNRSRLLVWTRKCEVVTAKPGDEFAFRTLHDLLNREGTLWSYTFQPSDGGTLVTESYDADGVPTRFIRALAWMLAARPDDMTPHMRTSLERIKEIAERQCARAPSHHTRKEEA